MTRPWTPHELEILREYPAKPIYVVANRLGRTPLACYQRAYAIGIRSTNRAEYGPEFEAFLREKHAAGWSDGEIAADWHGSREQVNAIRRRLGLPSNFGSDHHRAKMRALLAQRCKDNDVRCLGELGVVSRRRRAHAMGWPSQCTPAMCAVLDLLEAGPKTRQEIITALARLNGRTGVTTRLGGIAALSVLLRIGFVVFAGRRSIGRKAHVRVYALAPGFTRRQNVALRRAGALEAA